MGVKTSPKGVETAYVFHRKGGRSIIDRKPVFSPDGEYVLIIVENIVRVYNIQTGDCVRILEPENNDSDLIAINFPENEQHNVYGCSETGLITIWTWEKGAVLREKQLHLPSGVNLLTFDILDSNECFITGSKEKNVYLATYCLKSGQILYHYQGHRISYQQIISVAVGWSDGDRFAAICNGSKYLYIQNLIKPHVKAMYKNQNFIRILSVAAHSQESSVCITDALGRATVMRGNLYRIKDVAREVMHWHSLPLLACTFSLQGSYLLTGGLEKVLVKWAAGYLSNKANEKQYIPRLPGSIRFISTSASHIVMTLTNNTVVIANSQLRVVSTILECGGLSPAARVIGSTLMYHHPLGALILGGRTGHLQLYSTSTDKVLYNIDITQQNNIPPNRSNLLPVDTEVTCAAVSANGSSLVTSEYRNDGLIYSEERLKFWAITKNSASPFILNTCVNLSHGGFNVVSIALDNKGNFCVSAGGDRKFRIWKKDTIKESNKKKTSWSCLTACYYSSGIGNFLAYDLLNKFKNSEYEAEEPNCYPYMLEFQKPDIVQRLLKGSKDNNLLKESNVSTDVAKTDNHDMGGVAISQDGSLIAAWFGCKLTLWDSHLCNLRTTLSHIALRPKGVHVQFGSDDAAHYLVCTTEQCLAVWSLLSLSVKWIVQLQPSCLSSDPFSNKMAVVTTDNDVFVFTPHSSIPLMSKKGLADPKNGTLQYCAFGASKSNEFRLFMMRNDSELYCLEPEVTDQNDLEIISRSNLPKSNFSALIAEQQLSGIQAPKSSSQIKDDVNDLAKSAFTQFFSAASHMIPPVGLLSSSFVEQLSGTPEIDTEEEVDEENQDMDVDPTTSDDEDDEPSLEIHSSNKPELWIGDYDEIKENGLKKILKQQELLNIFTDTGL